MNYRNSEGYASPTEHEALTRIRHEELKEERQKSPVQLYTSVLRFHKGTKSRTLSTPAVFANMQSLRIAFHLHRICSFRNL